MKTSNTAILTFATKVGNLAYSEYFTNKEFFIARFTDIIQADGGDDDFADHQPRAIAKALISQLSPVEICFTNIPNEDQVLEVYHNAKNRLLGI